MTTAILQQRSVVWSDMRPKSASTDQMEESNHGFRPSRPRPKSTPSSYNRSSRSSLGASSRINRPRTAAAVLTNNEYVE
ncbi:Hypothetical predicted protein [Mytilus galloprovincialis]|uniref:Uncharacterized protein n=1 Tax=Mytilus galloprovincialis TaxID=29158 RepID=A0A8B6BR86_MYTGA|nr:Hypothetical predicted protein [Mytilus galloprovincialis]